MTRRIGLDQIRAEAKNEPIILDLGTETITLAPILPASFSLQVARLAAGDLDIAGEEAAFLAICHAIAGDQAERLLDLVQLDELQALIALAYGLGPGESLASAGSSPNGGNASRPT